MLLTKGVPEGQIREIICIGLLKSGENIWEERWGKYLKRIISKEPPGKGYHARHFVEKGRLIPSAGVNREILEEGKLKSYFSGKFSLGEDRHGKHGVYGGVPLKALNKLLEPFRGTPSKN